RDDALVPHGLGRLEHRTGDIHHHLGHAIVIAQVDEKEVPVITLALDPARQLRLLADMLRPPLAAGMGSVSRRPHAFPGFEWAGKSQGCPAKSSERPLSASAPCRYRYGRYRSRLNEAHNNDRRIGRLLQAPGCR